ncbi:MAG: hypothetical protein QNJ78_03870 [Gammaproteobacteria bacterium]|nr:hypothetical protein [Gammaproteobacteria bacterium]
MTQSMIEQGPARRQLNAGFNHKQLFSLLAVLSILTLTGCGNDSEPDAVYVSSKPISVPMRPGETEQVLFMSTGNSKLEGNFVSDFDIGISNQGSVDIACVNPEQTCWTTRFKTQDTASGNRLGFYTFDYQGIYGEYPEGGDVSYTPFNIFPSVTQALPPASSFSAGGDNLNKQSHSLAVGSDGSVWAWGANEYGQLGNGSTTYSALPVQVQGLTNIVSVAAGGRHSLALAGNGTVWAWGNNYGGQLGDGTTQRRFIPVQVPDLDGVKAIAAGNSHSLALLDDGTVRGWGFNHFGQLGDGMTQSRNIPVKVAILNQVLEITAGRHHSLARLADGTVWAWGWNLYGQLGDYSRIDRHRPVQVQDLFYIKRISAGSNYSLVLDSYAEVWSWGANRYGQLGRETPACTPGTCPIDIQRIPDLDEVYDIEAGAEFALALRRDGSVWGWGDNTYGQIPGRLTSPHVPTPIEGLNSVTAIAAGSTHAIAMQSDDQCPILFGGRLMAWGNNLRGTRGDGTAVNWFRPTPVVGIGDDDTCASYTGHRLYIYQVGTGSGNIASDHPGLNCTGMLCWQTVPAGSQVTLTATPDADSSFVEWNWDCSGQSQTMVLTMDSAHTCKVRFNQGVTPTSEPDPEPDPLPPLACADELDNDNDGLIDLEDPGCENAGDDSELNAPPPTTDSFDLTISITGEGEVFDNNDSSFFCFSEGTAVCVKSYPANTQASLYGISFGIEDAAIWISGCDNGTGILEACLVNMDRDRQVDISMQ